jgi:hypothetical protein
LLSDPDFPLVSTIRYDLLWAVSRQDAWRPAIPVLGAIFL